MVYLLLAAPFIVLVAAYILASDWVYTLQLNGILDKCIQFIWGAILLGGPRVQALTVMNLEDHIMVAWKNLQEKYIPASSPSNYYAPPPVYMQPHITKEVQKGGGL